MRILPAGIFEFRFIQHQNKHMITGNGGRHLISRIRQLAGDCWEKTIFRECRLCKKYQLFDDDFYKGIWYEKDLNWKELVKFTFPRFVEHKNVAPVTCNECQDYFDKTR